MHHMATTLIVIYLMISFAASVFEKVWQWNKSKVYYKDHFKGTFLKNYVPLALLVVIAFETISIGFCLMGLFSLHRTGEVKWVLAGMILVALTLSLLLTGQRIAQDYSGAMHITVYFILTVLGIFFLEIL